MSGYDEEYGIVENTPPASARQAGGGVDNQWLSGLQKKLGMEPSRNPGAAQHEPIKEIYFTASAEFVGTLLIVFIGGFSIVSASEGMKNTAVSGEAIFSLQTQESGGLGHLGPHGILLVSIAFSSTITILLWLFSRVSGGFFNIAVMVAFLIRKRITIKRFAFYSLAQASGSFIAAAFIKMLAPADVESCVGATVIGPNTGAISAFLLEAIFCTLLTFAYLMRIDPEAGAGTGAGAGVNARRSGPPRHPFKVSLSDDPSGQGAGMIGLIYLVGHMVLLPFTGASMNPLRSLGPAIFAANTCNAFSGVWVYWAGPMAGSTLATVLHGVWFPASKTPRMEADNRLQPIVPGSAV